MEPSPEPEHPDHARRQFADTAGQASSGSPPFPSPHRRHLNVPALARDSDDLSHLSLRHSHDDDGLPDGETALFDDGGVVLNELVSLRLDSAASAAQQGWSRHRRSLTLTPRAGQSTSHARDSVRDSSSHSTPRARSGSVQSSGTPRHRRSLSGGQRGSIVLPEMSPVSGPRIAATVTPLNVAQSSVSRKSLTEASGLFLPSAHRASTAAMSPTSERLTDGGSPREASQSRGHLLSASADGASTAAAWRDAPTPDDAFAHADSASYLSALATSLTAAYVTVQTSRDIGRIGENYDMLDMPTRLCLRTMIIDPAVGAALRAYNEQQCAITDLLFEDCTFSATVDFAWLETLESLHVLRFKGRQTSTLVVARAVARAPSLAGLTLFECATITSLPFLGTAHTPLTLSQMELIGTDITSDAFQQLSRCPQIRHLKLLEVPIRADLQSVLNGNTLDVLHVVRCANLYLSASAHDATQGTTSATASEAPLKMHTLLIADCESLAVRDVPWSRLTGLRELSVMYQPGTRVSAFHTILTLGRLTVLRLQQLFVDVHLVGLIRQCQELEELNLSFCRGATDMDKLWPALPHLKRLNLSFTDTETADLRMLKACTQLREVYMRGCPYLRELHVFHQLPSLELLDLAQCAGLEGGDLHGQFQCAEALTRLSLEGCTTLRSLSALQSLTALRVLNLSGSGVCGGEATAALGGFVRLRELYLSRCARLSVLPPLDALTSLVRVDLSESHASDGALQAFSSCTMLEELDLSGCESVTTLGPLGHCPSLRTLHLAGSAVSDEGLETFVRGPHPAYVLEELDLSGCTAIQNVSCLSALHTLQVLILAGSSVDSTLSFPSLVSCDSLEAISLCECYQVRDAAHLALLKSIRDVNLSLTGVGDDTVMAFGQCHTLETLELSGCHEVTTVLGLAGLPFLQRLNVSETRVTSESLCALCACPVLWEVNASGCLHLDNLSCFKEYRALQRLSVSRSAVSDASTDAGWQATMLEELDLSHCNQLLTLPLPSMFHSLSTLRHLDLSGSSVNSAALAAVACGAAVETVTLRDCVAVDAVEPLAGLTHLKALDLSNTAVQDESLSALSRCVALMTLNLSGCARVANVHALAGCRGLVALDLSKSTVTDASFDAEWPVDCQLKTLNLSGCVNVSCLPTIGTLAALETLDVSQCPIEDAAIAHMAELKTLRTLTLCECGELYDVTPLSTLPQLKSLDLSGSSVKFLGTGGITWRTPSLTFVSLRRCHGLSSAAALSTLPHLLTLDLSESGVRDAAFASPWDSCTALEELNVSGCLELRNIAGVCDLPHLTRLLAARSAVDDSSLVGIGLCEKLEVLDLSGCEALTNVGSLSRLPRLQVLRLRDSAVESVSFEKTWLCPSLHLVDLSGCAELTSVQGLRGLPRLQHLNVSHTAMTDTGIYAVRECQTLERLSLSGCVRTMNLASLGKLNHLRFLDLRASGVDITTVVSLSRCAHLEELDLTECPSLNNVFVPFEFGSLRVVRLPPLNRVLGAFLEACPDLEELTLRGCPASFQAQSFATLQRLKRLDLSESDLDNDFLSALRHCASLEELALARCTHLEGVAELAGLRELRFLDLTATPVRDDACTALLGCPGLQWLVLSECRHLQDISALAGLRRLRRLDVSMSSITDKSLEGIANIRSLEEVDLHGCKGVCDGAALTNGMPRLRIADFTESGLQSLPVESLCLHSPMLRVLRLSEGVSWQVSDATTRSTPTAAVAQCAIEWVPAGTPRRGTVSDEEYATAWGHWVGDVLAKIATVAH